MCTHTSPLILVTPDMACSVQQARLGVADLRKLPLSSCIICTQTASLPAGTSTLQPTRAHLHSAAKVTSLPHDTLHLSSLSGHISSVLLKTPYQTSGTRPVSTIPHGLPIAPAALAHNACAGLHKRGSSTCQHCCRQHCCRCSEQAVLNTSRLSVG